VLKGSLHRSAGGSVSVTVQVYTSHNHVFLRECCSSSSTQCSSSLIFSSFALIILSKSLIFFRTMHLFV
jgi:hypothetical protein